MVFMFQPAPPQSQIDFGRLLNYPKHGTGVYLRVSPSYRELSDTFPALLVPVNDAQKLSTAITRLLDNSDANRRRALCASEHAAMMTMTAMTDGYQALYDALLSRSA